MPSFQLSGLAYEHFEPLFRLTDAQLLDFGAIRRVATEQPGFPCRVSLQDAEIGEEVLLFPYQYQASASPYRASGPIFVRRGAQQAALPPGHVPLYVSRRLISLRAYDNANMMVDATVCEGTAVAEQLERSFSAPEVAYVHLHNAKQGCFSCTARRTAQAAGG
ncbi:DUF1203 domain-containing protein [Piscinibacter sp.]|jgi:hypothetical protein|uniref:DUF1203 domain-containing protein n=1 Tax=Piscinibacter sp. TaxID=1903157 RepID=UPI00355A6886